MKGKNLRIAERSRAYLAAHGKYTLSSVTGMEIAYGFGRVGRINRLEMFKAFLQAHDVLPFDAEAALLAGPIDAELDARGRPMDLGDVMIVAIALRHGLTIVTGNVAHFGKRNPLSLAPSHSELPSVGAEHCRSTRQRPPRQHAAGVGSQQGAQPPPPNGLYALPMSAKKAAIAPRLMASNGPQAFPHG
jgi:tRNA(fMet)-specific endonuclease VapC